MGYDQKMRQWIDDPARTGYPVLATGGGAFISPISLWFMVRKQRPSYLGKSKPTFTSLG